MEVLVMIVLHVKPSLHEGLMHELRMWVAGGVVDVVSYRKRPSQTCLVVDRSCNREANGQSALRRHCQERRSGVVWGPPDAQVPVSLVK